MDQPTFDIHSAIQAPAAVPPFLPDEKARDSFSPSHARAAWLREEAQKRARGWKLSPKGTRRRPAKSLARRLRQATADIEEALREIVRALERPIPLPNSVRWLTDHMSLVRGAARHAHNTLRTKYPPRSVRSRVQGETSLPLPYLAAADFLQVVSFEFSETDFFIYMDAAQEASPFEIGEIWALNSMVEMVLLEQIAEGARSLTAALRSHTQPEISDASLKVLMLSLIDINRSEGKDFFERLSRTHWILSKDPADAYATMEVYSREYYCDAVQELAAHSRAEETEVAQLAVSLAVAAHGKSRPGFRGAQRRSHVGYYLVDEGRKTLESLVKYRAPALKQVSDTILETPEAFFLVGIELVAFGIMAFALSGLRVGVPLVAALLLLLLPASEAAIGVINRLTAFLVPVRLIPKLDFSEGIPADCTTLVAIPTLLISEDQVRQLVRDLEIRYLGNRDAHLHFVLLTDEPDSEQPRSEKAHLLELCSRLVRELNERYRHQGKGGFLLFHRHPVFNESEGAWMGWERKRGKLLDLNNLLRGKYDSFPVKIGDLSILPNVRFVITLDSDTQLPRGTAHRLIGAMAHPLNRAVINPATNTVVEGYGVLQPRVGISVRSANRSRLANIYSGQTGLDPYTRAVSDVYQDLFGEGIFTGKGIYEVDVFQRVLGERFPNNAILSHDLIEGAYARAGLVTDVEVIDDYPSHFSAHSRRKHRWVRGDWQIMRWLFPRVPHHDGARVKNPLNLISRWKIFDNLRRSVIEAATFVLLMAAWFFLPGSPVYWTTAIVALLVIPSYVELLLTMPRLWQGDDSVGVLKQAAETFISEQISVLLVFALLAHQALLTLDAVFRTLFRLTVSHRRLLEWETAAESEIESAKRTPVDVYLKWTPYLAILIAAALAVYRPHALPSAAPILALWFFARPFSRWLDRPFRAGPPALTREEELFLRGLALRTWRYFRVFCSRRDHGLIPDNVREDGAVDHRLSPSNLGLLLNAQYAAYDLGFVTLPQFLDMAESTVAAAKRLPRYRGHFLNWYDTRSLAALEPRFVSSVDSGNLACCLWALKQGCLAALDQPQVSKAALRGIRDHYEVAAEIASSAGLDAERKSQFESLRSRVAFLGEDTLAWVKALPRLERLTPELEDALSAGPAEGLQVARWWLSECRSRLGDLREMVETMAPWYLPEYASLLGWLEPGLDPRSIKPVSLKALPEAIASFQTKLEELVRDEASDPEVQSAAMALGSLLPACITQAERLRDRLTTLASEGDSLVDEMDFRFLMHPRRKALSIGYDVDRQRLEDWCYDLLASEARSATFVAIAKGDIPQDSWFRLGRSYTRCGGRRALVSWTGTMFEYLLPMLWMKTAPGTTLDETARAAVACQQSAVHRHATPWGISEASFSERSAGAQYGYRAFGVPGLALNPDVQDRLVIAPYATFLALCVDRDGAINNLRKMNAMGWVGEYGFYESADFGQKAKRAPVELIRCWMAHHQGMSLLSLANVLSKGLFQRLFHEEPLVLATERLLFERVPTVAHIDRIDAATNRRIQATAAP
ncbi:MAG TPA: glucoamylase family protein [Terriglobia bacterium]|nr:glucoamylase family protein [Terriglobia bacterium]